MDNVSLSAKLAGMAEAVAGCASTKTAGEQIVRTGSAGTASATGLSMGMSRDLELAIAEGATIVRTGTAVFGTRPP